MGRLPGAPGPTRHLWRFQPDVASRTLQAQPVTAIRRQCPPQAGQHPTASPFRFVALRARLACWPDQVGRTKIKARPDARGRKGGAMARDAAVVVTWTQPIPGREAKALEVFMEALGWWGKQADEGRCSKPRTFFAGDGADGLLVVEGKSDALHELLESDDYEKLNAKGAMIVSDFRARLFYGGTDTELQRGTAIYAQAANELGYM